MFKAFISPVQKWLLSRGQCVGCSMPLSKGHHEPHKEGQEKVTCKCGRIFIYTKKTDSYRRALFEEI